MLTFVLLMLSVLWRINGQIISITQHPRNDTFCVGSTALLSCTVYDNTTNNAADNTDWFKVDEPPVGIPSTMINNTRNGDVVTSVLTIDNVSLNDNGTEYFCLPSFGMIVSYNGATLIAGLPGDITGINISPDTITACSFVVQWSEPSSDPVCGTVWYTVTISTEGGMLIITDNTTMTNYSVTGLNSNTLYSVNVTASNNAGSSDTNGTSVMTNSGIAIESPVNISVIFLNSTSFTVNWTISDPSYNYTVIWTNLNTDVVNSFTVPENTNSYTVAGLSVNTTYNVSISFVDVCGMMITSNTITVNITEEIPTDGSSLATSTSATDGGDDSNTAIVIVLSVTITITISIAIVVLVAVVLYFLWKRKNNKNSDSEKQVSNLQVPELQVTESDYSEPFNSKASQERSNTEYAYATTGPRGVSFHSTNPAMPQQQ